MTNTDWRMDAACGPEDDDVFYPDSLTSAAGKYALATARRICHTCPVITQCREDALDAEGGIQASSRFGIVAGMTPEERYNARRAETRQRNGRGREAKCGTAAGYRRHLRGGTAACGPCLVAHNSAGRRAEQRRSALAAVAEAA